MSTLDEHVARFSLYLAALFEAGKARGEVPRGSAEVRSPRVTSPRV